MKVMLDTNILISAALFPSGKAAEAFYKALLPPYEPVVCDYVIDELYRKFSEKFSNKTTELNVLLKNMLTVVELIKTPDDELKDERKIRDPKDRPILRAALNAEVELFLTGDKDFLESSITNPKIISVKEFLSM